MNKLLIKKILRRVRWLFLPGAAVALTACSFVYQLRVTVIPGDQVGNDAISDVSVIIVKAPHQRNQLSSRTILPLGENGVLTTEICCTPNPEIWLYAFYDTDGSGKWDADELLIEDADSPVRITGDYATTIIMP